MKQRYRKHYPGANLGNRFDEIAVLQTVMFFRTGEGPGCTLDTQTESRYQEQQDQDRTDESLDVPAGEVGSERGN